MDDYFIIQKRINYYSCYVKHLLNGLCEEFNTNKIHLKRISSVLDRFFTNEDNLFLNFFSDEKLSISTQFIHYLNSQGEIIHVGNSYYTLPPERSIILPNGEKVLISSLESSCGLVGVGGIGSANPCIFLNYDEYVFLPTFDQILMFYQSKLSNHHDVDPDEVIVFNEKGFFKSTKFKNMQTGEFYILKMKRSIGSRVKSEVYFGQWRNSEWYVTQIIDGTYLRTIMALQNQKKVTMSYEIIKLNDGFIEVKLQHPLPYEEDILLRLIATPEKNKRPKKYLTVENQLSNIRAIISNCKFQELEVNNDGIHN